MGLDEAFSTASKIIDEAKENIEKIRSEEDAKIQIITRLLCESLGWSFSDISAEKHHDNGYSDYLISIGDSTAILVEAKRIGKVNVSTAEIDKVRYLKLNGTGLKKCAEGINQAFSYSAPNGLPITVLTDGIRWIVFKTFPGGAPYKDKEAIVFPSLEAVRNDFSIFFDLLSKGNFGKKIYNQVFDKVHGNRVFLTQNLDAAIPDYKVKISSKSELAHDLDKMFSRFFSRLTGEEDEELLIECFVETKESRIADFSLEKMTASVLGNIAPKDKDVDAELSALIERNIDSEAAGNAVGQTIFIVGPTGAGKSTFLERFFKRTLPRALRERCDIIRVNFLNSSGTEKTLLTWLTEQIISSLEKQNYKDGNPSFDELQGLYYSEYQRRKSGTGAILYENNRNQFKLEFGQYLDDVVEKDREGYLKKILTDVVNNRKKLPIFVLDNTDEFSPEFKVKLFQFIQSFNRHAKHCLVIFPVTDKSAWAFSKTDIYGIHKSKSFFLPTPSPREVFRKRIDFLKNKILAVNSGDSKKSYFSSKGIKISIENIASFAEVLEKIFVDHEYTSKTIGELTNYNIRRTLLMSQRVITSSVFKVDDLVTSYMTGEFVAPNFSKFMDALIKGDYEVYKEGDTPEIFPVFQTDSEIQQSPLLHIRILSLLDAARKSSSNIEERHLLASSITSYFDAIGATESSIDRALLKLLQNRLIEPYDTSERDLTPDQRLAISHKGTAHLRLSTRNSVYFYQMALTTGLSDEEIASKIFDIYSSKVPFLQKTKRIRELFLKYILTEDAKYISQSVEGDQYESQNLLLADLRKFSDSKSPELSDASEVLGEEYKIGYVKENMKGVVEFYDLAKGFGFLEIEGMIDDAFLPQDTLMKCSIESPKSGDELTCDIIRAPKGWMVQHIHSASKIQGSEEITKVEVIKIHQDRPYGFVKVIDSDRDALFHFTIVPEGSREKVKLGVKLEARLYQDKSGRGLRVKEFVGI